VHILQLVRSFQEFFSASIFYKLVCWKFIIKTLKNKFRINLKSIPNVQFLQNDIFDDDILDKIDSFFDGKKINLILSDMSPNSTGNKKVDHLRIVSLIEKVLDLSNYFLSKNGFLIAKIFQGGAQGDLIKKMNQTLSSIRYFKPKASRAESPETYLVAQKK